MDTTRSQYKTKLCISVSLGTPCKYIDNCKFAHSIEELKTTNCLFGERCSFVRKNSEGKIVNNDTDTVCHFVHPGETRQEYIDRITKKKIRETDKNTRLIKAPLEVATQLVNIMLKEGIKDIRIIVTD